MKEHKDIAGKQSENIDLEELLREKEKLESLIKRKFTRKITLLFTDISGSTRMSEILGDFQMRTILKDHNEILFPSIRANKGVLVKTMGDGTMSYFDDARAAVKAAIDIQRGINAYNTERDNDPPLMIRCGLNTGLGIVEKNDVYGDVVNVAQRFESMAEPKQILISQDTYHLVKDDPDINVVFLKEANLRGKLGPQKTYRVLWLPADIKNYQAKSHFSDEFGKYVDGAVTGDLPAQRVSDERGEDRRKAKTGLKDARIVVERKGKDPEYFPITKSSSVIVIGRSKKADIMLPEVYVSRKHAQIIREEGKYYLEDLKSNIGTQILGEKIIREQIKDGDEFVIGSVKLVLQLADENGFKEIGKGHDAEATMLMQTDLAPQFFVEKGGMVVSEHVIGEKPTTMGRMSTCNVKLDSPMVSRQHAKIYLSEGEVLIEDLNSNNGTIVNGKRVNKAAVGPEDDIQIGPFTIKVRNMSPHEHGGKDDVFSLTKKVFSFLHKK